MSEFVSLEKDKLFIREFERKDTTILRINQCSIGDVGCVVWDAAIVLSSYLESRDFKINNLKSDYKSKFKGKSVIELGSGTGLVGLNACCEG